MYFDDISLQITPSAADYNGSQDMQSYQWSTGAMWAKAMSTQEE